MSCLLTHNMARMNHQASPPLQLTLDQKLQSWQKEIWNEPVLKSCKYSNDHCYPKRYPQKSGVMQGEQIADVYGRRKAVVGVSGWKYWSKPVTPTAMLVRKELPGIPPFDPKWSKVTTLLTRVGLSCGMLKLPRSSALYRAPCQWKDIRRSSARRAGKQVWPVQDRLSILTCRETKVLCIRQVVRIFLLLSA